MAMTRTLSTGLAWRVVGLAIIIAAAVLCLHWHSNWLAMLLAGGAVWGTFHLFYYLDDTNRRLARLFESIRYSDFAIRFASAKEKGKSFQEVNRQFNEVLEAFRQTRAEKEANLLFLNTIVQHLGTGVLAFDAQFGVLLSNNAAFQVLGVYRLHHLNDLPERHKLLSDFVRDLRARDKLLYQPEAGRQLTIQGVSMTLQGRAVRLLTLQNIHPELQRKELEAWRDLTRVLRHEIMNSVTPIVSLIETMQDIVRTDLKQERSTPALDDLEEALEVVATRSRGLMDFVEAYRSFSAIPPPKFDHVTAKKLLDRAVQLAAVDLRSDGIRSQVFVVPENLQLDADVSQIEMVLLNLIRNAREAFQSGVGEDIEKRITLRAGADHKGRVFIEVEDNGPGITADLREEIFIPFFTTKNTGTGVGLSISKQIMQLHGGDIRVSTATSGGTRFVLEF